MVEAQHIASTMKIVDNADEQDVLESLLEASKPSRQDLTTGLHYLLVTPFRYDPRRGGSRFRAAVDPGVFYGAQSERTAASELGYWRWRFLKDAVALKRLEPVAHTAFTVDVATNAVDIRKPPFDVDRAIWQHKSDYSGTQAFARIARETDIGAILYQSVRDPEQGACVALLTPSGFVKPVPKTQKNWFLVVTQDGVTWKDNQSKYYAFEFQDVFVEDKR